MSHRDSQDGQGEIRMDRIREVMDARCGIMSCKQRAPHRPSHYTPSYLFHPAYPARFYPVHPVNLSSLLLQRATKRLLLNLSPPSSHVRAIRKPVSAASAESSAGSYL